MKKQPINLLKSVIQITQERDKRSLEYSFLDILAEIMDFEVAMLLQVSHISSDWNLEVLSYYVSAKNGATTYARPKIMVPLDDWILGSIEQQTIQKESQNSTTRIIYPIIVNNIVKSLLVVYTNRLDEHTDRMIEGFTKIYANFVAVLDDNERDTLTGLFNRKAFDTHIAELIEDNEKKSSESAQDKERRHLDPRAQRWVGILDIDHFKRINDQFGHLYGDEVLMMFANIMQSSFRKGDLLFRYGGEEFVTVLMPTQQEDAMMVFNRFRKNLENTSISKVGQVTVSIGIARIDTNTHPAIVLENADRALYFAKDNGRNRVCNYHDLIQLGALEELHIVDEIELF